jgi:hypothetical protein
VAQYLDETNTLNVSICSTSECNKCGYKDSLKPLLGCCTYDIVTSSRILELSQAINRYSDYADKNTDLIRKWAKEIILQCDFLDKMNETE